MKLLKNAVVTTLVVLTVLIQVFLVWSFIETKVMTYAYQQGAIQKEQEINQSILDQMKNNELKINIDGEEVILVPKNDL